MKQGLIPTDDEPSYLQWYHQVNTTHQSKVFFFTKIKWLKKPLFLFPDGDAIPDSPSGHVDIIVTIVTNTD